MERRERHGIGMGAAATLPLFAVLLGGCLGEPEIQDRWTRLDVVSSSLTPYQSLSTGAVPITVSAAVTYRKILTGFAVAELRGSSTVAPGAVEVHPDANRVRMAQDIDAILAGSVTLGRATRAVTGWDHLVQHIDFAFTGTVPAALDSTGPPAGLFLVCYLGQGTEIERADGTDSLIVTPFPSTPYEILPVGLELGVVAP
jgi:hypothetical protein